MHAKAKHSAQWQKLSAYEHYQVQYPVAIANFSAWQAEDSPTASVYRGFRPASFL